MIGTGLRWLGGASALGALAVVGLLRATPEPPTPTEGPVPTGASAELVQVRHPVEIGSAEAGRWQPAQVGNRLAPGQTLRTGWSGTAELVLEGNRVRLYENSAFRLPASGGSDSSTQSVHLDRGSGLFDVVRRSGSRRFEVHTPEAVAAVRGTRFGVRSEEGEVTLLVYEGSVVLDSEEREEVLVRAGFGARADEAEPFELAVIEGTDPWDEWKEAGAALPSIDTHSPLEKAGSAALRHALDDDWSSELGADDLEALRTGSSDPRNPERDWAQAEPSQKRPASRTERGERPAASVRDADASAQRPKETPRADDERGREETDPDPGPADIDFEREGGEAREDFGDHGDRGEEFGEDGDRGEEFGGAAHGNDDFGGGRNDDFSGGGDDDFGRGADDDFGDEPHDDFDDPDQDFDKPGAANGSATGA